MARFRVEPSPRAPVRFFPQHSTLADVSTTQAWWPPSAIWLGPPGPPADGDCSPKARMGNGLCWLKLPLPS